MEPILTNNEVRLIPVEKHHMSDVVQLLQEISAFAPQQRQLDEIWDSYQKQEAVYSLVAVTQNDEVVGYGTLLIEIKIRGGKLGHIEDIVVHGSQRGSGLGKKIVGALVTFAENLGCYKVVLTCSTANAGFYMKSGLALTGVSMHKLL
jgi:glucosamine-phosphate N-acetyltransferase